MIRTRNDLDELYRRFAPEMFRRAFRLLGDSDEARDCVQTAFLALWEHRASVLNAEAYLNTMVVNHVAMLHRSLAVRQRFQRLQPIGEESASETEELPDEQVRQFVATQLTDPVRRVVECVFYQRMTYKATAECLSLSVATVNKHVVTALRLLRQHFRKS